KISIVTNFEYLIIFLTYDMPNQGDTASTYRYKYYNYSEYIQKFDEIYHLLSRESVIDGTFDQWTNSILPEHATKTTLDSVFLEQLNIWRVQIGNELFKNENYSQTSMLVMNEEIQEFLNQIIFLRFAEDNRYESPDLLKDEILSQIDYLSYFRDLDK
ncbi:restriction endonuclease, partial [Streptococcus agalactiae]|nr:restriction endonuclease [Streptococcus agalactiae]